MPKQTITTDFALTTSAIQSQAAEEDRRAKLVRALRTVTYLASQEQYDVATRVERARVARIAVTADEVLRKLLNPRIRKFESWKRTQQLRRNLL